MRAVPARSATADGKLSSRRNPGTGCGTPAGIGRLPAAGRTKSSRLRAQAAKEKQLARQVELNLTLKRIQSELAAAQQQL
jgi:hypothetical protein